MNDKKEIINFIHSLNNKNYASADKHLQKAIENKLFNKIKQQKNINIFSKHERKPN